MIRIRERNEWLASKLLTPKSDKMFAGVVVGNNPGEVWVDDETNPSTALVWSEGLEGFNFMGKAVFTQTLGTFIEQEIVPFLQKKGLNEFEFSCDSEEWIASIHEAFTDKKIDGNVQYVYQSDWTIPAKEVEDIRHFKLVEIDENLLTNEDKKNLDFMIRYITTYWDSVERFLEKGYGYVVLTEEGEAVSIAISSAVYGTTHAVGIETVEAYRKRGLSGALTTLIVNKLRDNDLPVWWDCMESNIASQKTAEKAGLVRTHPYNVYWFSW
jgi:RimJ/RimL family protein N-acetyltransferase